MDGASYLDDVTPIITGGIGTVIATLNGNPYTSGTPITTSGDYLLSVSDDIDSFLISFHLQKEITIASPTATDIQDSYISGYSSYSGTSATSTEQAIFNIAHIFTLGEMALEIPKDTEMTRTEGGTFNFEQFTLQDITSNVQAESGGIAAGCQDRDPQHQPLFSVPITVSLTVPSQYNGQTLESPTAKKENQTGSMRPPATVSSRPLHLHHSPCH